MRPAFLFSFLVALLVGSPAVGQEWAELAHKHTIELADFTFHTGETLPSVKMIAYTLGEPQRDETGRIANAVMLLHGTGGSGRSLLRPAFGDELFGPGQPLDIEKFYIISPDNLGHGDSSKPSDGLRAKFPRYDYDDMVLAQHRMLTEGFGVSRLELIVGTSMGCMHSFVWGQTYPGFARRLVPLACNAIEIAGRNLIFRQMVIDGFERDPAYDGGNYRDPAALTLGQQTYAIGMMTATGNPYRSQAELPTRAATLDYLRNSMERRGSSPAEPNDTIYQFAASRNYDPSARLEEISVPVLWINSQDDFINPPGLGNPEGLARRMPNARFVLIPASADTRGHGTHSYPEFWKDELSRFLARYP